MLLAIIFPLAPACNSAAMQRQKLASDYPLDRARAAVALAEAGDKDAVHKLIDLLDDDDRAVRLYAILALERLCGTTMGYTYYAPQADRDAAVRRWREAIRNGEVVVRARPRADGAAAPGLVHEGRT